MAAMIDSIVMEIGEARTFDPSPIYPPASQKIKQGDPIEKGMDDIDKLDLTMVKMKLCLPADQEGKGWTPEEADDVERWYKRFLRLQVLGFEKIVPTKAIDEMWHAHI